MMFKGKSIYDASFEVFAENYHTVRPGYPQQLFDEIRKQCGLDDHSKLLEIGAGSGIATRDLAQLGRRVLAIEPGKRLAEIARKQTSEFGNVEIAVGTFETLDVDEKFNAVLAFSAYHWIDEGIRYHKVRNLLTEDGSLVLVWNSFFLSGSLATVEINNLYHTHLPEAYPNKSTVDEVNAGVLRKLQGRETEVVANEEFYTTCIKKYPVVYRYNTETYPKLLNTFPKILEVEDEKKKVFFEKVAEVLEKHGGIVSVPVLTTLIICKRKRDYLTAISATPE